MKPPWVVLVVSLALSACAQPASESGLGWYFRQEAEVARLFFGVPDTDSLSVLMTCEVGEGRITVSQRFDHETGARFTERGYVDSAGRPEPWPADMTVQAGARNATARGKARVDEMDGGTLVVAGFDVADPVWPAFATGGKVVFQAFNKRAEVDGEPVEADARRRFVAACRKKP